MFAKRILAAQAPIFAVRYPTVCLKLEHLCYWYVPDLRTKEVRMKTIAMRKSLHKQYRLTRDGLLSLTVKLQELRAERKRRIATFRAVAEQQASASHEDSGCIQTMTSIRFVDAEIERIENVLAEAEVLEPIKKRRTQHVSLGSSVKLRGDDGQEITYVLVDSIEADPSEGRISDKSPLGQQLLGKRIMDYITLKNVRNQSARMLRLVGIE